MNSEQTSSFFYNTYADSEPVQVIDPNQFLADGDEAVAVFGHPIEVPITGHKAPQPLQVHTSRGGSSRGHSHSPGHSMGDSSSVSSIECSVAQPQTPGPDLLKRRKVAAPAAISIKREAPSDSSVGDVAQGDMSNCGSVSGGMGPAVVGADRSVALDMDTVHELLKEQEVKKQRLARKAELARMSRKRKKTRMGELELEVEQLKEELERERKTRKIAQSRAAAAEKLAEERGSRALQISEEALASESKKLHGALRTVRACDDEQKEAHAAAIVGQLIKLFARKDAQMWQNLTQMKQQMSPALPLRFLDWVMHQQDKFYQDDSGLWASLFQREIGLTEEQLQQVLQLRADMSEPGADKSLANVEKAFDNLASELDGYLKKASVNMQALVKILSAEQLAQFFTWVETYGAVCVKINV